jgi:hypothetical protein
MLVILRLCATIFGGVPHVDDTVVVSQGTCTRLLPNNLAEPCNLKEANQIMADRHSDSNLPERIHEAQGPHHQALIQYNINLRESRIVVIWEDRSVRILETSSFSN